MAESPAVPIEVAVGVVRNGRQILVTRRASGAHLEGLWEFPGGKVNPGETPEECVCREVLEETGLEVKVCRLWKDPVYAYPDWRVHLHFFLCDVVGGALEAGTHGACWTPVETLPTLEMPPANEEVVKLLQDYFG